MKVAEVGRWRCIGFNGKPIWTIWTDAFGTRQEVTLYLPISRSERAVSLADHVAFVERRKAELSGIVIPRNAGNRRTESKKALLKAIEEAGGKW